MINEKCMSLVVNIKILKGFNPNLPFSAFEDMYDAWTLEET